MKVALVHDFLARMRGGEKVLLAFHEIWPDSPIYTFIYKVESLPEFKDAVIKTSFFQHIPWARNHHEFFPIFRIFTFGFKKIKGLDVVLSSASAEAKYIRVPKNTIHICYCHTPTRYYWSDYELYKKNPPFGILNPLAKIFLTLFIDILRKIDYKKSQKVDYFIANSNFVRDRIKKYYNRDADVIYPPVEADKFYISNDIGSYFLILGQLVWYKRADIVVEAFNKLGIPLKIAGEGKEVENLKKIAGENVEFLGRISDKQKAEYLSKCRAVIFPQVEDFGIVPLEAMASGRPVIAYRAGGALESITEGITGEFFDAQTAESVSKAVKNFDDKKYDPKKIRAHAFQFDVNVFKQKINEYVETKLKDNIT